MSNLPPPPPPPPPPAGGMPPAGAATPDPLGRPLAEAWERAVGGVIDAVLIGIVVQVVNFAVDNFFIGVGAGFVVAAIYYTVLNSETTKGQTVGKMVLGMRTVEADTGNPPDMSKAAGRGIVLAALVQLTCCIGGLIELVLVFTDKNRQTIHDKVGKTYVVKAK